MKLIPVRDHPSNLDKTASLSVARAGGCWSVYRVTGGYCATVDSGWAVEGLFPTVDAAAEAGDAGFQEFLRMHS